MVVGKEKNTMVTHIHVMLAPPRDLIVSGANMRATNITAKQQSEFQSNTTPSLESLINNSYYTLFLLELVLK